MGDEMDVLEELRWRTTTLANYRAAATTAMREWDDTVRRARAEGRTWAQIRAASGASPDTVAKALKRR